MHHYEIIEQGQKLDQASKALILLHGRGSNARDILKLANDFADDNFYVAAPEATNHSWYPHSFLEEEKLNEPWLSSAVEIIKKLIDAIAVHIPKNKIYIMGFSQGACLTLEVTARFATKYGGIAAFSGGLIGSSLDVKKYHGNFKETKAFIGVSDHDPYIPLIRVQQSKELMEKLGADITLKVYPGPSHTIYQDEKNWVKKFIMT